MTVAAIIVVIVAIASASILYATFAMNGSPTTSRSSSTTTNGSTGTTSMATTTSTVVSDSTARSAKVVVNIAAGAHSQSQAQNFVPSHLVVVIGVNNTVQWNNNDNSPHTVTSDGNIFDSGAIASGSTFSFTFTTPGNYSYHCSIHPWMKASVLVLSKP